jgi:hypothetical protein
MSYDPKELEEAKRAIMSVRAKCEKAFSHSKEGSAQQTLLKRRIEAFRLAIALIEKELTGFNS